MAQHDYVIDNQSAPSFRADLNSVLAAIVSGNSGGSAPTVTFANMLWYDTTNNQIKKRNETDTAWIILGTINETLNTFTPSGSVSPTIATQAEAEAGTDNTKMMTPLRSSQAISALGGGTVLLGTLTTTSGSTQTLSGLVLTPFRSLWISFQGVSGTASSALRFASPVLGLTPNFGASSSRTGYIQMDLTSGGAFLSNLSSGGTFTESITAPVNADVIVGRTGYTTATTSIGFSLSAGTFDAGTIAFYGVK